MSDENNFIYELKKSLMTDCEKNFYEALKNAVPEGYVVQPQINLQSIINRIDNPRFVNELFRNIDFGVFDSDYKPIFLVEINDNSHLEKRRQERDEKVLKICEEAGIPIVILWTSYGVNFDYIKKRVDKALEEAQNPIRVKHSVTKTPEETSGCYVATCVYGSYDCPSVWVLRRFRDYKLKQSFFGRMFIKVYYAISPKAVKLFGDCKWFRSFFRKRLDKMVTSLRNKGYEDTNYYD